MRLPFPIRRRLTRLKQVDNGQRLMLVEASAWLLLSRLALVFVPFPKLARRLGEFVPPGDPRVARVREHNDAAQAAMAESVGWAVTRAARHVPFKAVCLPQAMAARVMLKRRGVASVMHFGAAKGTEKPLDTHAWLDAAGVEVTGYPVAKNFSEIGCFV